MRVGLSDRKVNKIIDDKYKKLKYGQSVDNVDSSPASDKAQSSVLLLLIRIWLKKQKIFFIL